LGDNNLLKSCLLIKKCNIVKHAASKMSVLVTYFSFTYRNVYIYTYFYVLWNCL